MTMLDRAPKREPSTRQLESAYLGMCDIDDRTWQQVGNRTMKRCAKRGSKIAREAHVTTSHPTRKNYLICWIFLLLCLACPAVPVLLKLYAARGA